MELEDCLEQFTERVLHQILALVGNAIVFLDTAAAECLHWCNGVEQLFHAGALQIRDMSTVVECLESETKCVFVIGTSLNVGVLRFIKEILHNGDFNQCTVVTSVPTSIHDATVQGPVEKRAPVFSQLSKNMKLWMGNEFATADVRHVPLFVARISRDVFVTPPYHKVMPILPSDVARLQSFLHSKGDKRAFNHVGEIDIGFLPNNLQLRIKMLASSLNSFFEAINVNEDCYGCGHFGNMIATELANMPSARARRKMASNRASIIVVDRLLDVVGPLQHRFDSMMDKILEILPRLNGHHNDVEIDLAELFASGNVTGRTIFPGCLSNPGDPMTSHLIDAFIMGDHKECISLLCGRLVAALKKENMDGVVDTDLKPLDELHELILRFRNNFKLFKKHSALLQFSMATHLALTDSEVSHMEEIYSSEKMIQLDLFESPQSSPLNKVFKLLTREHHYKFSVVDAMMLALYSYSLAGDQCRADPAEEEKLMEATIKVLLDGNHEEDLLFLMGDSDSSERQVRLKMADLFERMKCLAKARDEMKQFRTLLRSDAGNCVYSPLLLRLVHAVFHPDRPELPDVEFRSHGLTDFLKTGFSLFMNVSKPRPDNHPLLVLFVVGGVSCSEIRDIRQTVKKMRPGTQVIIGSTGLVTATDMVEHVLCQENLFVDLD